MKNLVIVESPAKAKTIEKYLGRDFVVKSSFGHVRDLPKKGMSINIENDFVPTYEVNADKKKTVTELRKLAKEADTVWLASDEDREGEAIAWHLAEALNLKPEKTKRIVFHEITESAILEAIKHPRTVDKNIVDAQQARRVLDRLVGYELSPVLWKKVRPGLSAGRVQSVAVRLIVEREREIEGFEAASSYRIIGELLTAEGKTLKAEVPRRLKALEETRTWLEQAAKAAYSVLSVESKPSKRSPAAPFTTSTLQQEASRKLGFSVKQTMVLAQRLYEAGHITYMRTDSVNLAKSAVAQAAKKIEEAYGKEFVQVRTYKTKSAGAQEAHEAIRPTNFFTLAAGEDRNQQRLYELIWKRAIASQMAEAQLEKTVITINISTLSDNLEAKGEVVTFEGFLSVYLESSDDDETAEDDGLLPAVAVGESLELQELRAKQTFTRPKPRYTEASLVKQLEELGIGRPSTYAPTISTVQDRGYVEKADLEGQERNVTILTLKDGKITQQEETEITGADRSKLIPTPIGEVVTDFLVKYFSEVVDYQFTASVETEFDEVEEGKKVWNKMISEFYGPFHKTVTAAEGISRLEATDAREIGIDPKSGKPVIARVGRYGPMVQIGVAEDEDKPRFAGVPSGTKLDSLTLEAALKLFDLPRVIGETPEGEEITANTGRFGPYIKFGSLYVSIKPDDPYSITLERSLELIAEKKKAEAEKNIKEFDGSPIKVLNGRYGPYISDGKKNAKIPKDKEPAELTLEESKALLDAAPEKSKRRKIPRRK